MLQAADESHVPFLASAITFDALLAAVPFVLLLLVGLTFVAQHLAGMRDIDPLLFFHRFLPPHETEGGQDPFAVVEDVLAVLPSGEPASIDEVIATDVEARRMAEAAVATIRRN